MTDDARVVVAGPAHAGVVAALQADGFPDDRWSDAAVAALLADPAVTGLLLAADDGEPLGFVLLRVAADEAEILSIAARSDVRRRGVGARLLGAAVAVAARRGVRHLFLEVSEANDPALRMYTTAGFEPVGRRRHYYGVGADALVLRLAIAPGA